jgi:predicted transcriptional regulator
MRVLLSIRPEFAKRIFDGSKRYEYRRVIFKQDEVTTVVVYASDPVRQVIGEFDLAGIVCGEPRALWAKTGEDGGIAEDQFLRYFENRTKGYAIGIGETRLYPLPVCLDELAARPPQSFMYLR